MAESVIPLAKRILLCGGLLLSAMAQQGLAQENLPDPTRPPATLQAHDEAAASGAGELVLQSVLISPGRKVAVISGETVQVGDRVSGARVVRIAETQVDLVRDGQSRTLKLFPKLEKRRSRDAAQARETGRPQ